MREYVKIHKKIHQSMKKFSDKIGIIRVNDITKDLGMDLRTVKNHLIVCEIDGFGRFIEENIFITRDGIRKMAESLGMKIKE